MNMNKLLNSIHSAEIVYYCSQVACADRHSNILECRWPSVFSYVICRLLTTDCILKWADT